MHPRDGRQRGFTSVEVARLAAIFGISVGQLTKQCGAAMELLQPGLPAWLVVPTGSIEHNNKKSKPLYWKSNSLLFL